MTRSEEETTERNSTAGPDPAPPARPSRTRRMRPMSQADKLKAAERAFAQLVELMNDGSNTPALRRSCANDIIELVWGNNKEPIWDTPDPTVTDVNQLSDEERAKRITNLLDRARARTG